MMGRQNDEGTKKHFVQNVHQQGLQGRWMLGRAVRQKADIYFAQSKGIRFIIEINF